VLAQERRFVLILGSFILLLALPRATPAVAVIATCDATAGEETWIAACQAKYPTAVICSASCITGVGGETWLDCTYVYPPTMCPPT
jgi:hypothetical protein